MPVESGTAISEFNTCSECVNCNNHGEYFSCDAQDARVGDWVISEDDDACDKFAAIDNHFN